jgi:hypothetical protein
MTKQTTTTRDDVPPAPPANRDALCELPDPNGGRWTGGQRLAFCVLGILGFASCFSHVWDSDIFWHLACGEWMFRHHEVMRRDCFCLDANPNGWIDVHWLFQLIVTAVFKLGGWGLLSVFKGAVAAGILMTYVASLRKRVPTAWLMGVGILLLCVMQSRIRTRPEIFTLGLLVASFALVDSVRRGAHPTRLWWMVPIMIFWVNIHGLFFLGLAIAWGLVLGAALDWAVDRLGGWAWAALAVALGAVVAVGVRRLELGESLGPIVSHYIFKNPDANPGRAAALSDWIIRWLWLVSGTLAWAVFGALGFIRRHRNLSGNLLRLSVLLPLIAATFACLVSPWPIETLRLPLLLSTRLSDPTYVTGVTELHRTTSDYLRSNPEVILLTLLTVCAMLFNFRNLSLGHIGVFAVFVAMAMLALRNVAMLGPVLGFLLALHGGAALKELGGWKPFLRRLGPVFSFLLASGAVAISTLYLAGMIQRFQGVGTPGPGLQRDNFNMDAAQFMADLDVQGDLMCENFGDGGVFDYYLSHDRETPRRLLYMDGRLEAHSLEKFNRMKEYRTALSSVSTAGVVELPETIRFILVRYDSLSELSAMSAARYEPTSAGGGAKRPVNRFRLIYVDQAGALFQRMDWNDGLPGARDNVAVPEEPSFAGFDLPLGRDGLLQGAPNLPKTWYRHNVPPVTSRIADLLLNLGKQPFSAEPNSAAPVRQRCIVLAIRHFHAAKTEGLGDLNQTLALLAQAYAQRAWEQYYEPSAVLPIDIDSACALRRFPQMYLPYLPTATQTAYCQIWVDSLVRAGMLDHAQTVTEELFSKAHVKPVDTYGAKLQRLRDQADKENVYRLPLLERAEKLASRFGLIDQAIAQLKASHDKDPKLQMLLGDLLLRQGVTEADRRLAARSVYAQVNLPPDQAWQVSLRLALCDWVEGNLWPAADALKTLAEKTDQPVIKFYRLHLAEELGDDATVKSYAHDADLAEFTRQAKKLP